MTSDKNGNRYTVADIDITRPNVARVYDCFLGGKDNFAADREFVRQALEIAPKAGMSAKNNRAFLSRVVRHLVADVGLTQLLDIGSGLPTQGNVSEIAHAIDPTVHVVHVDNDPIVYTHSKALLTDSWTTDIVVGDVRKPAEILADPDVRKLIDFEKPIGLLLFAILHHVTDDDEPGRIAAQLRDAMPDGSYLALLQPAAARTRAARTARRDHRGREAPGGHARQRALAGGRGDPHLVRRLGTARARPGVHPGLAPRAGDIHRAGRELPQLLRRRSAQAREIAGPFRNVCGPVRAYGDNR